LINRSGLASKNTSKSNFWSSNMQVKDILHANTVVQINRGNLNIRNTAWCHI
jgi:hypothetical protein